METSEGEKYINPEIDSEFKPAVDLFRASEAQRHHLKERINRFDGSVRIFVHPAFGLFYDMSKEASPEECRKYQEMSEKTVRGIIKMLEMSPKKCPPIILMEEEQMADGMVEALAPVNNASQNEFYRVITHNSKPAPLLVRGSTEKEGGGDAKKQGEEDRLSEAESWFVFLNDLAALGVKKVILGGGAVKYDELSEEELGEHRQGLDKILAQLREQRRAKGVHNTDYVPRYCLGTAIMYFSKMFQIDISGLSFPDTLADLRKIEYPKKTKQPEDPEDKEQAE